MENSKYFYPTLYGGYKYFVKRPRIIIGFYGKVLYDTRDYVKNPLGIMGIFTPPIPSPWNWWGGITIGKYF